MSNPTTQRPCLSRLPSVKKLRAKLSISQLLRPAPPKRNDTPFNFTETLANSRNQFEAVVENDRASRKGTQRGYHIRSSSGGENISPYSLERPPQSQVRKFVWKLSRKEDTEPERAVFQIRSGPSSNRRKLGSIIVNGSGFLRRGSDTKTAVGKLDFVRILPPELTASILSYLDHQSLAACERVSTAWSEAASCPHIWREVFHNTYGPWVKVTPGKDWKRILEAKHAIDARWEKGTVTPVYLKGHTDSVYCIQHDQQRIFTGSRDRTIRVWDVQKAECIKVIGATRTDYQGVITIPRPAVEHHRGSILCLQFDDEILVSGSSDHTCIVYSLIDYQPILKLRGHRLGVLDVAFDKQHIVSCSKDMTVIVWDRATGVLLHRLQGHTGTVNAVQLRGDYIVSASGDADVKLWNIHTGELVKDFKGHTRGLACVQFSEDGNIIVSAGNDLSIRVWDVATGKLRYEILDAHVALIRTLHLDARNGRIISGSYDQCVKVWCLETGKALLNFPRWHSSYVLSAKSDYRRIISTGQDSQVLMLDFSTGLKNLEMLL